ncbi:MAG: hypothetical protein JXB10_04900 [Pirellulales bacterium]|nr:hypothetical protein [Pirellulales bacterium]
MLDDLFQYVQVDGQQVVRLRSKHLDVDVAPEVGGKIVGIRHVSSGYDFLWRNPRLRLEPQPPGSEYDPYFFGGIDELIPNDVPETVDGAACPDHGELWTSRLECHRDGESLLLTGVLPVCGLQYRRRITLRADSPHLDLHYRITNTTDSERHFLWKLHAALAVAEGDVIDCPARRAQVVDLAYSRFSSAEPFSWPTVEGRRADVVPADEGTVDFFYLFDLPAGRIAWKRPSRNLKFEYAFDTAVFPYAWLFASYGGFDGHYTVILEPCTTMPIRVGDAIGKGTCSRLLPRQSLETHVSIYAGPDV